MPIVEAIAPVLGAVAPIIGGVISGSAATSAASTQAKAENAATANTKSMFDTTVANLQPYNTTGQAATTTLANLYGLNGSAAQTTAEGNFTNSPDYAFAQQQGIAGLDASAASKGGLLSGNQLEAITNYSSGLATQNFNNYANRLAALGSQGENAAAATGTASANAAASEASTITGAGNATAGGIVGGSNAVTGGFNTGINNLIQAYGGLGTGSSYGGAGSGGSFNTGNTGLATGAPMPLTGSYL